MSLVWSFQPLKGLESVKILQVVHASGLIVFRATLYDTFGPQIYVAHHLVSDVTFEAVLAILIEAKEQDPRVAEAIDKFIRETV